MTFDNKIPFPEVPFAARQHHNTVRLKMHFKHDLIFFEKFSRFFFLGGTHPKNVEKTWSKMA